MIHERPLNPSPLELKAHHFRIVEVKARDEHDPQCSCDESKIPLGFHRVYGSAQDDDLFWRLQLTVDFGKDSEGFSRYHGKLMIEGYFRIAAAFERREDLIKVTGASMLYGACREMLANITARGPHKMLVLPSISFIEPEDPSGTKPARAHEVHRSTSPEVRRIAGTRESRKKTKTS